MPSAFVALLGGVVVASMPEISLQGTYSYFFEAQRRLSLMI
jgi:hypothetical protein